MASNLPPGSRRVLVVDDNRAIHEDFLKILGGNACGSSELLAAERLLLGGAVVATPRPTFRVDTALQGEEGVARVQQALQEEQPYAMAFIDMRMPPAGTASRPSSACGRSTRTCRSSSARRTRTTTGRRW